MTLVKLLTLDLIDYSHKIQTDMNMNVFSKCDKHHSSVVWPNSNVVEPYVRAAFFFLPAATVSVSKEQWPATALVSRMSYLILAG